MSTLREAGTLTPAKKQMGYFERYLSLWVGLCMVVGVILGRTAPGLTDWLRRIEFAEGSQVNLPIAILLWLMITPMMMRVDFSAVKNVGRRPKGLVITLIVNWLVKPFSMALIGTFFFRWVFSNRPVGLLTAPRHLRVAWGDGGNERACSLRGGNERAARPAFPGRGAA